MQLYPCGKLGECERLGEAVVRAESEAVHPIADAIAAAHHGSIDAQANPDGGLTVRATLPTPDL